MKKIYILLIVLLGIVLVAYVAQLLLSKKVISINSPITPNSNSTASQLVFKDKSYDFGLIKQSVGSVSHKFPFTYVGQNPIKIIAVPTSCDCTSASVSPTNLKPGDSGVLTVNFNPNFHAEPQGKFFKSISFITEPQLKNSPEIKIWANIDLDLGPQAFESKSNHDESQENNLTNGYKSISAAQLNKMLQQKDFTLIDVHIPLQQHIKGTDQVIAYNQLVQNKDKLPQNKNAKIVVYCRSGGMSQQAAATLEKLGYTNVYDLVGGKRAYDSYLGSK